MEKSLLFNAFPDEKYETGYDRNANADDLREWFAMVFETGVVKENQVNNIPQGLRVVEKSGMTISLNVGHGAIKGSPYSNTSKLDFVVDPNGTTSSRFDYVVLEFNNEQVKVEPDTTRKIRAFLRKGTSTKPTRSTIQSSETKYEIVLAIIEVKPNATSIGQENIIDTRSDKELCGWFTAVKGYEDYYDAIVQRHEEVITLSGTTNKAITQTITSNLYNSKYSLVEVYVNGLAESENNYNISIDGGFIIVNFKTSKASGSKIKVVIDNFIDGEGMTTALSDYLQWKEAVAKLEQANEYTYICNGVNDNVKLSEIAQAWLNGGTDYGSRTIKVHGTFGATNPYGGDGTSVSPYTWLRVGTAEKTNRKIIFDFTNCGELVFPIVSGTYNSIFFGVNAHIVGANVIVNQNGEGTIVRMFSSYLGSVYAENCRFWITSYKDSVVGYNGTFINCRASISNVINNSYCFVPSTNSVVKVVGGEYYSYTGDSTKQSAIVGQSGTEAVSILYGVSAPTLARSGYYQTNSILQFTGGGIVNCTDLISELPMVVVSGSSNIRGTIAKSKTNVM